VLTFQQAYLAMYELAIEESGNGPHPFVSRTQEVIGERASMDGATKRTKLARYACLTRDGETPLLAAYAWRWAQPSNE
jgi:hypothetical protein